jgi:hypothetical protein
MFWFNVFGRATHDCEQRGEGEEIRAQRIHGVREGIRTSGEKGKGNY